MSIFLIFVQILNEFNARKPEELNVFSGVTKNYLFMGIIGGTFILQVRGYCFYIFVLGTQQLLSYKYSTNDHINGFADNDHSVSWKVHKYSVAYLAAMAYMLRYCHHRVGLCTTIIQVSYAPCIHIFKILNCLYFLTAGLLLLLGNSFQSPRLHSTSTASGRTSGSEELLVIPNASIWLGVCIFLAHQSHLGGRTTLVV